MYDIGGRIPKRFGRLTGARQTHALSMRHMLQFLSSKGGAHVKYQPWRWPTPFEWLSLFGGLTVIVGVVTVAGKKISKAMLDKLRDARVRVIQDEPDGPVAAVARPYNEEETIAGRPNFELPETVAELRDGAVNLAEERGDLPSLSDDDDDELQGPQGLGGVGVVLRSRSDFEMVLNWTGVCVEPNPEVYPRIASQAGRTSAQFVRPTAGPRLVIIKSPGQLLYRLPRTFFLDAHNVSPGLLPDVQHWVRDPDIPPRIILRIMYNAKTH